MRMSWDEWGLECLMCLMTWKIDDARYSMINCVQRMIGMDHALMLVGVCQMVFGELLGRPNIQVLDF